MAADKPANNGKTTKRKLGGQSGAGFKPGQSGNPSGRPKTPQEFKDIVKANTVDAIKKVLYLMNNADKEDIQLKAAQEILDRGLGKATQVIDADIKGEMQHFILPQEVADLID